MSVTPGDLEAVFREIEVSFTSEAIARDRVRLVESGTETAAGPVLVGTDGNGDRRICVPASESELGRCDRASHGIALEVRKLADTRGRFCPYLNIICLDPELAPMFLIVARDILRHLEGATGDLFARSRSVLEKWRALLRIGPGRALGQAEIAAVYAELYILERLTVESLDAVRWWTGPDAQLHDFTCPGVDIEVKSSLATSGTHIEVSDLAQLEPRREADLHLAFVRLRALPVDGDSIPAMVKRLIGRGIDAVALYEKLALLEITPTDLTKYADIRLQVEEALVWAVDDGFPRLRREMIDGLPSTVTKIRYTLQLDALRHLAQDVDRLIEGMGDRGACG